MGASRTFATTGDLLSRSKLLLLAAVTLAALLASAGSASAATFAGESTTNFGEASSEFPAGAEVDLVKAAASYDTNGSVTVVLTTAGPPQGMVEIVPGEPELNKSSIFVAVAHAEAGQCNLLLLAAQAYLTVDFTSTYGESGAKAAVDFSSEKGEELPATKVVSGNTTTLSLASGAAANLGLNCALIAVDGAGSSVMAFPLTLVVPPPPTPASPGPTAPAPAPMVAPAKLEITKPKPVALTVGKWRTVKLTVANTGSSALSGGTLRVKPAKGVYLKPETQKLPVLAPGDSFALSVRVEMTKRAKKKSTLSLQASGPGGVTGTSSLVVKAATTG
ncbi:MAG TPA: hypothetical protein VGH14_17375 [Solirubrobacterales bacterium]|jgi:hypothetical protein